MEKEEENKLLELSQEILVLLANPNLNMTEEEKNSIEVINQSILFFMDSENYQRAIGEYEKAIKILKH